MTERQTPSGPTAMRTAPARRRAGPIINNPGGKPAIPEGYEGPQPNDQGRVAITFIEPVGQYNPGEVAGFSPAQAMGLVQGKGWAVYGAQKWDSDKMAARLEEDGNVQARENGNNAGQTRAIMPAEGGTAPIVIDGDWRTAYGGNDKRRVAAQISKATGEPKTYQELSQEEAEVIIDAYLSQSAHPDGFVAQGAPTRQGVARIGRDDGIL